MNQRYVFFFLFLLVSGVSAQTTLYQERFPAGNPELVWVTGDGLSRLQTSSRSNPSGDNTVGYVKGLQEIGGTGQILSGAPALRNYRIEAQVFMSRSASAGSGTNNGIFGRVVPAGQALKGYVLASDFDSNNRLRLRKFTGAGGGTPPAVIRDWPAAEIPSGIPSTLGWHKLALEFNGNQINAYYDDQLLPGSPFTDTESDSGYFGIYCFTGFDTPNDSATFFDDVLVTAQTTSVAGNPSASTPLTFQLLQNYPNPLRASAINPATTIPFALNEAAAIQLEVLNLAGQRVVILANGRWPAGEHRVQWRGAGFPSGAYLLRMQVNGQTLTRRMLMVK